MKTCYLGENIIGDVAQFLIRIAAFDCRGTHGQQNGVEEELRCLQVFGYVDILVHAEDFRMLGQRQVLDEFDVFVVGAFRWNEVEAARREFMLGILCHLWIVEIEQSGAETSTIPIVRHCAKREEKKKDKDGLSNAGVTYRPP